MEMLTYKPFWAMKNLTNGGSLGVTWEKGGGIKTKPQMASLYEKKNEWESERPRQASAAPQVARDKCTRKEEEALCDREAGEMHNGQLPLNSRAIELLISFWEQAGKEEWEAYNFYAGKNHFSYPTKGTCLPRSAEQQDWTLPFSQKIPGSVGCDRNHDFGD